MLMALSTSAWTLAELDRLPDDGNAYALVSWDLFVTRRPRQRTSNSRRRFTG